MINGSSLSVVGVLPLESGRLLDERTLVYHRIEILETHTLKPLTTVITFLPVIECAHYEPFEDLKFFLTPFFNPRGRDNLPVYS